MIQNYTTIKYQVDQFNKSMKGVGQIQKIFSSYYSICLNIRYPGKNINLYIGRGGIFEGIFTDYKTIDSKFRCRDKFLEYVRKHLTSCLVESLEIDSKDRIIILRYIKLRKIHTLCIFWHARKLDFVHKYFDDKKSTYRCYSNFGVDKNVGEEFECIDVLNQVGRTVIDKNNNLQNFNITEFWKQEELMLNRDPETNKKRKFLKKKIENIKTDIERLEKFKNVIIEVENKNVLLSELSELSYSGIKIKFAPNTSEMSKLSKLYEKLKSLKKVIRLLQERLANSLIQYEQISSHQGQAEQERKKLAGPEFLSPKIEKEIEDDKNEFSVFDFSSYQVGIGLSARGNDQLRSKFSTKSDWWCHLESAASAHAIIKIKADYKLLSSDWSIIASLLVDQNKQSEMYAHHLIPIIFTQVKNLKSVKGSPGLVLFKNEKHISVPYVKIDLTK